MGGSATNDCGIGMLSELGIRFVGKNDEICQHGISELKKIKHLEIMHIPKGGFFIWVNLANYINSEKFYYKCRLRGLSILPGFIFYSSTEEVTSKIRISIVPSTIKEMKRGLEIIQDVLNNCDFKLN